MNMKMSVEMTRSVILSDPELIEGESKDLDSK